MNISIRFSAIAGRLLAITMLLLGLVFSPFQGETNEAQALQSIRLPFPPLYEYAWATNSFSEDKIRITDACQDGQGGTPPGTHIQHTGSARFAVDFGMQSGVPIYAPVSGNIIA